MTMQLYEYVNSNGMFEHLLTRGFLSGYPLLESAETMDSLLVFKYGDRVVLPKLSLSTTTLAAYIDLTLSDKWTDLLAANNVPTLNDDVHTVQETITNNSTKENNAENLNKVSAYDSDVLITDDGNTLVGNETANGETVRTLTDSNSNHANQYVNISTKQKNNIIDVILYDIADAITLSVY